MNIKPNKNYLVLREIEDHRDDSLAPPIKDDWLFEVAASFEGTATRSDGAQIQALTHQYQAGSKVIVKEITVKTENYIITHIDNVVGVVE